MTDPAALVGFVTGLISTGGELLTDCPTLGTGAQGDLVGGVCTVVGGLGETLTSILGVGGGSAVKSVTDVCQGRASTATIGGGLLGGLDGAKQSLCGLQLPGARSIDRTRADARRQSAHGRRPARLNPRSAGARGLCGRQYRHRFLSGRLFDCIRRCNERAAHQRRTSHRGGYSYVVYLFYVFDCRRRPPWRHTLVPCVRSH